MTGRTVEKQNVPLSRHHRVRVADSPFDRSQGFQGTWLHRVEGGWGPSPLPYSPDEIALLPTTAESFFFNTKAKVNDWERLLKVILAGVRNEASSLAMLRDHESTLVREIYSFIDSRQWAKHVKLTIPAGLVGRERMVDNLMQFHKGRESPECYERRILANVSFRSSGYDKGFVAFARCGQVEFPPPTERNVNMMPFIFGDKDSLPDEIQCYYPLIEQCPYMLDEIGKIGFLTVHESYVNAGKAQRREGLHIEAPGVFSDDKQGFTPAVEHGWGSGVCYGPDRYEGGIYMASSVDNTSEVWDALVSKNVPGVADEHGGCEHLRGLLGRSTKLKAGELIWMTDCTPHEAVPQETPGPRQFFRVVMPYVTHWYAEHSTPNPKVPVPSHITVIEGSKFKKQGKSEG